MLIRIWLRCKYECEPLQLCGVKSLFVNQKGSTRGFIFAQLSISSQPITTAHFSFIDVSAPFTPKVQGSEIVCVELLNRYCIPIVLYATEAVYLNKACLKRLDKLVDAAVHKIFNTFDEQIT